MLGDKLQHPGYALHQDLEFVVGGSGNLFGERLQIILLS
jgi:hypothetical protein